MASARTYQSGNHTSKIHEEEYEMETSKHIITSTFECEHIQLLILPFQSRESILSC